jgi:integrative and conjugative element protein (TIGR02256 family)
MAGDAYFSAPGEIVGTEALVLSRSSELAEFLATGTHRNARLVETRLSSGADRAETIVMEVDVEVGQVPVRDVRPTERVAVTFSESDRSWPEVLALRLDFPRDVPHLFPRSEDQACSLCLYEDSFQELKLRWTAVKLVERIRFWLRETSRSTLHGSDQPLEPLLVGGCGSLVLPTDLFSASPSVPERLSVLCFSHGLERNVNVYVATRSQGPSGAKVGDFAATIFVAEPRSQSALRFAPGNLLELDQVSCGAGLDLIAGLRTRLLDWQRDPHLLQSRLILVVAFPKTRSVGSSVEASDIWAFATNESLGRIGEVLSLWQTTGGIVGGLVGVQLDKKKAAEIALSPLNPCFALSRTLAAAANGVVPDTKRITAIGVGALGSQIVGILIRAGFGQWNFLDEDTFLPHNVARHELPHSVVGWPKATAMAQWANTILAEPTADAGIVANVLDPGRETDAVRNALGSSDVIADFSASQAVARHLARDCERRGRCVSAFMNPNGTDVVVLAEDSLGEVRIDVVEMQYYRMLLENPELEEHFRVPEGRVRTARSCRDVSTILPGDVVALHAAVASRGFRVAVGEDEASIRIWASDTEFNTRMFHKTPARVVERSIGNFRLVTDEYVLTAVQRQRQAKLPRETGGVLLGAWDLSRKIVYIVATIASPEDSEEYATGYIRGCRGLEPAVSRAETRTGGQLQYLGEWHSHPDGYSADPSDDDRELFAWLRGYRNQDGFPPVMLIVAERETQWFVGSI